MLLRTPYIHDIPGGTRVLLLVMFWLVLVMSDPWDGFCW